VFPVRILLVMVVLLTAACDRRSRDPDGTISTARFIQVNVELREIPRDHERADSLRAAVLGAHEIQEEDLRRFVLARANRPDEIASVWEEIHRELIERREPEEPIDPGLLELDDAEVVRIHAEGANADEDADTGVARPAPAPLPRAAPGRGGLPEPRPAGRRAVEEVRIQ
jgi:hypothetical protein